MSEMNQDWIEKMRRDYNAPPDTPSREMWSAIESRLGSEGPDVIPISAGISPRRRAGLKWLVGVAAAAAILVTGIGLGRMTVAVSPEGVVGIAPTADDAVGAGFRAATVRHFEKSESLLTLVRSDAREGRLDEEMARWGRTLLLETRLLKDSPAGRDEVLRRLLEDLELILVQVAFLVPGAGESSARHEQELGLIAEAMQQQNMMMRLRSVLPGGGAHAGI